MTEQAWEAAARYDGYRQASLEVTQGNLSLAERDGADCPELSRVVLTTINSSALSSCDQWESGTFDWPLIVSQFRPYIDRFDVAVWLDGAVLGLGIGRPSKGPDNLTLHFVERRWSDNPLRGWIAQIVTDAADNYAKVLGKQRVKLKNPVLQAVPKYESLNFRLAERIGANTYYSREVS
jgi:hypothetical protein